MQTVTRSKSEERIATRRPMKSRATLVAVLAATAWCSLTANAQAWSYTNIIDWNLVDYQVRQYGNGYTIGSTGDGAAYYRWADSPSKTTVISGNSCGDGSRYGKTDIAAGNTSYHGLFGGFTGLYFLLRGRTATGSGAMYNHDGVLRR